MSYLGKPKHPQSLMFATVLGCITSYYVVSKLLDDVDDNSSSIAGMRIFVAAAWSLWLLFAIYVGFHEDASVWYLHLALLSQLAILLFHAILKIM